MPLLDYNLGKETVRPHIHPSRKSNVLTDDYFDGWNQLEELNKYATVNEVKHISNYSSLNSDDRASYNDSSPDGL